MPAVEMSPPGSTAVAAQRARGGVCVIVQMVSTRPTVRPPDASCSVTTTGSPGLNPWSPISINPPDGFFPWKLSVFVAPAVSLLPAAPTATTASATPNTVAVPTVESLIGHSFRPSPVPYVLRGLHPSAGGVKRGAPVSVHATSVTQCPHEPTRGKL